MDNFFEEAGQREIMSNMQLGGKLYKNNEYYYSNG